MGRHSIDIPKNEARIMLRSPVDLKHFHRLVGIHKKTAAGYYKDEYERLKPVVKHFNMLREIVDNTKFAYNYTKDKTQPNIYIYYGIIEALSSYGLTSTLIANLLDKNRTTVSRALNLYKEDTYRISQIIRRDVVDYMDLQVIQRIGVLAWNS